MRRRPPRSTRTDTLFPYTTLFRSYLGADGDHPNHRPGAAEPLDAHITAVAQRISVRAAQAWERFSTLQHICPVFLDLKIPGAHGEHVPLGAQLVLEGDRKSVV